ncbi:membrane protein [Agaricicola taiwanensis]|uniref:Membrane protein n=1 Tax=Agaricicola taiwanensis TaxID=591372 RepID=A0A8J2Y9U3_9RHOB|nr:Tim44 domain-containing protein [Agaricicola taiwanensis]GGE27298.1 membrane protein [Agaricicola taiwanensis]
MLKLKSLRLLAATLALGFSAALVTVDYADARRGGGFGSRGTRTYSTPAPTQTAPSAAPIQRSTTQPGQQGAPAAGARQQGAQAGGLFGGMGRGLMGGLLLGGLFGMLLGTGFGGMAGFLGLLLQVGAIILVVMLVRRMLAARRQQPAAATASGAPAPGQGMTQNRSALDMGKGFGLGGGASAADTRPANAMGENDLVGITPRDLDVFEQLLIQVQSAFAREDYAALRKLGTPEVMSYFAEELSQNATNGLKNEVTDLKLLQGDLSEAWREGDTDYATVAMRYEMRDVMRDRATGALREGDTEEMVEVTEIWTFQRERGGDWKLSAIQDA